MLGFILFLTIALPIAWIVSEFQPRRWLRVTLGCLAISMCFGVAYVVGTLERINYNVWFGNVTKDFVDTTIEKLDAGHSAEVLTEMKRLQSQYAPSYENRGNTISW